MQTSVPKFASFRPKSKPPASGFPDDNAESGEEKQQGDPDSGEPRTRAHDGKHHKYKYRHEREQKRADEVVDAKEQKTGNNIESHLSEGGGLYVIDSKGDPDNITYGVNSKYAVPAYIDPPDNQTIGLDYGNNYQDQRDQQPSLLSNASRRQVHDLQKQSSPVSVKFRDDKERLKELAEDFVPLEDNWRRNWDIWPPGSYPDATAFEGHGLHPSSDNYMHVDASSRDTSSEEHANLSDQGNPEYENQFRSTQNPRYEVHRLSMQVAREPGNINAWLDWIKCQPLALKLDFDGDTPHLSNIAVAKRRLPICQEALIHFKSQNRDRELLLLSILSEGEFLWERNELIRQWKSIADENPLCLGLQLQYINFLQSNLATFSFDIVKERYTHYLETLETSFDIDDEDRDERLIYGVLRLTVFLKDTGFHELGYAIWQAIIEINFLNDTSPAFMRSSEFKALLGEFEEFWDSERPRVGEEGGFGWKSGDTLLRPPDVRTESGKESQERASKSSHQLSAWFDQEQYETNRPHMPGRAVDEQNEDPFRVIFFADIKKYIFRIQPASRVLLLNAFLCHYQFPPLDHPRAKSCRNWWLDEYICSSISTGITVADINIRFEFHIPSQSLAFEDENATAKAGHSTASSKLGSKPEECAFVKRVLGTLIRASISNDYISEYYLLSVFRSSPSEAKKMVKSMLKSQPSNMKLYTLYALMESNLGNTSDCNRIFELAITMAETSMSKVIDFSDIVHLKQAWAWTTLKRTADASVALSRLLNGKSADDVMNELKDHRDDAVFTEAHETAVESSISRMLISYLSNGCDLSACLQFSSEESATLTIFSSVDEDTSAISHRVELFHQYQADLIWYHVNKFKNYSPKVVRETIRGSVASFPNNTKFLKLYSSNERHFAIESRIRRAMDNVLLTSSSEQKDSVVSWAFYIVSEVQRGLRSTLPDGTVSDQVKSTSILHSDSTKHSVRLAFEKALDSQSSRHCAAIWSLYLLYEIQLWKLEKGQGGPSGESNSAELNEPKKVFYRGLAAVPWCKNFAMMAFDVLDGFMDEQELHDIYGRIYEKGLRIHVDLEDVEDSDQ